MKIRSVLVGLVLSALFVASCAAEPAANGEERADLGKHFVGYTGTFVLYDEGNNRYLVVNEEQSRKRLSPCSSFKIYNSLIGLQTGVLAQDDAATLERWDGIVRPIPAWNKDQTLASATRDSVVWYYQRLALKIGPSRMQDYLDRLDYGNRDISGGQDQFWLQSSLQVSAREQVELLRRLHSADSPFDQQNLAIVKRNITQLDDGRVHLMGKTGSGVTDGRQVLGWFVGLVERDGQRYYFATNIEGESAAYGGKAAEITRAILKDMGLL